MADIKTKQNKLNEKFFKEMDDKLIARLREQMEAKKQAAALTELSGIDDEALILELVESGVCVETLAAFRMVPLLAVAWSDGVIQDEEREAIMKAASQKGITDGTDAHALLDSWIDRHLPADVVEAWKDYTEHLLPTLSPSAVVKLKNQVIGGAEQIAASAGGFLGLGSISSSETKVINDLKSVFPS